MTVSAIPPDRQSGELDWTLSRRLPLTVFGLCVLLFLLPVTGDLWTGGDDGRNLLAIQYQLHGQGFRLSPQADSPEFTTDRGYLLFLAGICRLIGGEHYPGLKLVNVLALAGSVVAFLLLLHQHRVPRRAAWWSAALVATSPVLLGHLNILIPEPLFLLATLLFLVQGEAYLSQPAILHPRLAALLALGVVLYSLGNAALILFLAFGLAFAARGTRRALLLGVPAVALLVPLIGWWRIAKNLRIYLIDKPFTAPYYLPSLYNLAAYLMKYVPAQIVPAFFGLSLRDAAAPWRAACGWLLGLVVSVLIGIGLWSMAGRRRTLAGMTVLVALAILSLWHVIEGGRFLVFILPLLVVGFVHGLDRVTPPRYAAVAGAVLGAILAGNLLLYGAAVVAARTGAGDPAYRSYVAALQWIADRDPAAAIACRKPHPLLYGHPYIAVTDLRTTADLQHSAAVFVVADTYRDWSRTALRELLADPAAGYREVYRGGEPPVVVYQRQSTLTGSNP